MCRLDPAIHDAALKHKGCRTVVMRKRLYRGSNETLSAERKKELDDTLAQIKAKYDAAEFSGVESGQMNSGDEGKALTAMLPEGDGGTSVVA